MKYKVIHMSAPDKAKAIFFTLLIEGPDGEAFIIPGWKIYDGRIYPPAKGGKGAFFYSFIFMSEAAAEKIVEAVLAAKTEGVEVDPMAYVSMKWGKTMLAKLAHTEEAGLEIWARNRKPAKSRKWTFNPVP